MFSKSSKVLVKVLLLTLLTPLYPPTVLSKSLFDDNTDKVIANNNNIVTVEVKGKGLTIDKAIQKAAVNALKKVAGTFVDSKTLINDEIKKTKIMDPNSLEYYKLKFSFMKFSSKPFQFFCMLVLDRQKRLRRIF